jgi:hypothetical protein
MHLTLNQRNPLLERRLVEVFYYMFHRGFFIPEPNSPNAPLMVRFYMTERGHEWLKGADPLPEEGKSYMEFLSTAIPNLDRVVRQYVQEALIAYDRQAWFAAAVMLGAAAEKVMYLLADSLKRALGDGSQKERLSKAIRERTMLKLSEVVTETLQKAKQQIPYEFQEGVMSHLSSFFEAIRVQRNDAVHPTIAEVSPNQVRMTLAAFPRALAVFFGLVEWLAVNSI